jgi:long-chain acyl-CoA synthetase
LVSARLAGWDRWLVMAPMFHAAGTVATLAMTWLGAAQVMLPTFDPARALDLIATERVTATLGVPTMISALADEQLARPRDVSTLRLLSHGGSPIASEILRRAHQAFPDAELVHYYGATETAPIVTALPREQLLLQRPQVTSCGQPVIGVQVRIVNDAGAQLPAGRVGEVAICGRNVMSGYWNKPTETLEVLRDGWYLSGDLGYLDDDSYLYLVDRKKDMIITGGENVYSTEVEDALYSHPAVLEAAVFGVPDPTWGEAVYAVVVPRTAVTAEDITEHCRSRIAGYKLPKAIEIRAEPLPKSGAGKVLKRELRQPHWAGIEQGASG